jgi:hypothetical protein
MELQINPVFAEVIPELTLDEFAQLEENILAEKRIIDPIITWNGYIVDGHNRYKIAQKHPEIPFQIHEKEFENEDEVVVWICSHQLGRRNINEIQRKCLIAKKYESEKNIEMYVGNQYTLPKKSGVGPKGPPQKKHGTRAKMAEDLGVSERYIRNSVDVLQGVNAAEEAVPGVKKEFFSGQIKAFEKDIIDLVNLPIEARIVAIESMRNPQKSCINPSKGVSTPSKEKKEESEATIIEDNVLGSMQGCVDTFISTYNNFYVRFPKLREEAYYRKQTLDILKNLKKYIEKVEGELK